MENYLLTDLDFTDHSNMGGSFVGKLIVVNENVSATMLVSAEPEETDFRMPEEKYTEFTMSVVSEYGDLYVFSKLSTRSYEMYRHWIIDMLSSVKTMKLPVLD
jgi:hypothetical protein